MLAEQAVRAKRPAHHCSRTRHFADPHEQREQEPMIRKLKSGANRLYSRKERHSSERRDLGTFRTREEAEEQEREVLFFKRL